MNTRFAACGAALVLCVSSVQASAPVKEAMTFGSAFCTKGETWTFSAEIETDRAKAFTHFLKGNRAPVVAFSEGLALRRFGSTDEAKFFGEYWVSRALLQANLIHVAWNGFSAVLSKSVPKEQAGIQLAALSCVLEIQARMPALQLTSATHGRIIELAAAARAMGQQEQLEAIRILQEAASARVRELVSQDKPEPKAVETLLSILREGGPHEQLAQGLWAAKRLDHRNTIAWLRRFLTNANVGRLERYRDHTRVLLGRAHFSTGEYEAALNAFKTVTRSSNELAQSLSDLAWAQLLDERYSEAIGTAVGLRAGGLRNTFTPESPMVMSMAMNELCQYPQSVQAIQSFKKRYGSAHKWLNAWLQNPTPLYPKAVKFLASESSFSKDPSAPPTQIASDWIRSPLFIAYQDEINSLYDEKDSSKSLARAGSDEQKKITTEVLRIIREVKPKLKLARMKLKEGEQLPIKIQEDLALLKQEMLQLRRLRTAAPVWRMILANHQKQAPQREARLVADINADLARRTRRMFYQLEEIAENLELVEVEIYNGASQDIIWQNAHPDYKKVAQEFSEEKRNANKVWDWGRVLASSGDSDSGEIWEDELGSFKAAVFDNCSSKDRYLALKMKRGSL